MFPNMQHSQELALNENLHSEDNHTGSFLYEERLDSTMLELQETFESSQQPFTENRREDIKQEALSDADGSEIHVEEIEMDSLISDQHEDYHTDTQSEAQHLMESMAPSIRAPSPTEDLIESIQVTTTSTAPTVDLPTVPQTTSNSVLSQPSGEPDVPPVQMTTAPTPSLPQREEPASFVQRDSDNKSSSSNCTDSDERFLLSCAPILRRLPNKKNQLARLRIQQLLFELEYDEKYSS